MASHRYRIRAPGQCNAQMLIFVSLMLFCTIFATATPAIRDIQLETRQSAIPGNQCPTTPLCCDNMVESTSSPYGIGILSLLGYPVVPGTYVGGGCLPITYYGVSNTVCPTPNPPLCCGRDEANGFIVADCVFATY